MEQISADMLREQLRDLGVRPGDALQVHTAFSKVKPVEGGPLGLMDALVDAVGAGGTLVVPSMSDDDEHPFDPARTSCRGNGIVADLFWRQPGVLRSDSPHAFAAIGPNASDILAPHSVELPHGPESPVGRVHDLDGRVLLLGVNHDADTTIHLAECMAGVRYRRQKYATVLANGAPVRREYGEIDHCCERFDLVDDWLDERGMQAKGRVGHAESRLARARDIVDVVLERLAADETTFLHPFGIDEECDEARASIPTE